jgi:alanyl-tRNA synthetase
MEIKKEFINHFVNNKFDKFLPVSLLSKAFPSNFTPSGGEEHINDILNSEKHPIKSFCTIQPCFRYQDIDRISTGVHLPSFDMGIAVSINEYSLENMIDHFLLLFDKMKLDRKKLHISVFKGDYVEGIFFEKDKLADDVWRQKNILPQNIKYLDTEENFFLLKKQGYGGFKTEMFYEYNGQLVEIGVIVRIICSIKVLNEKIEFATFENNVICFGMGIERWVMLVEQKQSVWETSLFDKVRDTNFTYQDIILCIAMLKLFQQGARLNTRSEGRTRVYRKLCRKVFNKLNNQNRLDDKLLFLIQKNFVDIEQSVLNDFETELTNFYLNDKHSRHNRVIQNV